MNSLRTLTILLAYLLILPPNLHAFEAPIGKKFGKIGIICNLPQEQEALTSQMESSSSQTLASRKYTRGILWGIDTVVGTGRVGKVASAITTTHMIETQNVDAIIFLGTAGGIDPQVMPGDVVVGTKLVQYDIDSRPITPQYTIPLLRIRDIEADPFLSSSAIDASGQSLTKGRVHQGLIGTADRFVSGTQAVQELQKNFPDMLAIDTEGGAVAQVCYEHEIPFVIIRIISNTCQEDAAKLCLDFVRETSPQMIQDITKHMYTQGQ